MVCNHLEEEARGFNESAGFEDVLVTTYPSGCDDAPSDIGAFSEAVSSNNSKYNRVHVFVGFNSTALQGMSEVLENCCFHKQDCSYLLAGKDAIDKSLKEGAHLLAPGQVKHWRRYIAASGFDQKTAQEFFRESTRRLLLLDTGVDARSAEHLKEFADFVKLPFEIAPVGMDYFRLFLTKHILEWRTTTLRQEAAALAKKNADYATSLDLVSAITQRTSESDVVSFTFDLFSMVFAPQRIFYLPINEGKPGSLVSKTKGVFDVKETTDRLLGLQEDYAWTKPNNGFTIRIKRPNEVVGVVEVTDFAHPERKNEYLNLALLFAEICGLMITNTRRYELLKENEDRFHSLIESGYAGILSYDKNLKATQWNSTMEHISGMKQVDVLGKNLIEMFPFLKDIPGSNTFTAALNGNVSNQYGMKYEVPEKGKAGYFDSTHIPLRNATGAVIGGMGIIRDITERMRAEAAQHESEERLHAIMDNTGTVIFMKDTAGRYLHVNRQFEHLFHVSNATLMGKTDYDIFPKDMADAFSGNDRKVIQLGLLLEAEELAPHDDGVHTYISVKFPLRRISGEIYAVCGIATDITERKRMEASVRQSERLFRNYFEFGLIGMAITSTEKGWLKANHRLCEMLGYTKEELSRVTWVELTHPDDVEPDSAQFRRVLSGEIERYSLDKRFIRKNGDIIYTHLTVACQRKPDNSIEYFIASLVDITDRRKAEDALKKLNETLEQRVADRVKELDEVKEQLYHAQKMESVGRLAGNIAHDFNNKLMAIMGYANLVEMQLTAGDPALALIKRQLASVEQARTITQSLLAFSRKQPVNFAPVSLNKIIEDMRAFLPTIIRETVVCRLDVNAGDSLVMADTGRLEQVLMNITKNAVDAMPNGGRLTISVGVVELGFAVAKGYGLEKAGPHGAIAISDTGTGMGKETLERIFEPFFTTKEKGKGTGLGLPIAYGIVKQHNGHLAVFSELNKGTTFTIYLPLTQNAMEETAAKPLTVPVVKPPAGGETILVAEDEDSVRDVLTRMLQKQGYKTIVATDGEDAVSQFKENMDTIRLLVFDVMMPGKNGKEAFNAIKKIKPDSKVLFLSGYSEDAETNSAIIRDGLHFIQKPVDPDILFKKVREILDA